ncbi:MAG TPA: formyltransferase family protein [Candidatus Dormibacteraeota bacterium]|nr:formyltransferase family protein [Candidatus Dormibacteraeota bacterium]
MPTERWRIALITTVTPIAEVLTDGLRQLGHEPVAVISARRRELAGATGDDFPELGDSTAPKGLDVLIARDRQSMEPLLRAAAADLAVCWGFSWRIPQAALDVPRLGVINCHPALLPRHRGPIPISWAFRDGDEQYGLTWHRMDASLDTGGILAQTTIPMEDDDFDYRALGPRMIGSALGLLPRALERVAAGDPGDPQPEEGASWAGLLGEDYATVDWSQRRRSIHNQVRAWAFAVQRAGIVGPVAELDGRRVRLLRTALADPGDGALKVDAGDGPIWVVKSEPLD